MILNMSISHHDLYFLVIQWYETVDSGIDCYSYIFFQD